MSMASLESTTISSRGICSSGLVGHLMGGGRSELRSLAGMRKKEKGTHLCMKLSSTAAAAEAVDDYSKNYTSNSRKEDDGENFVKMMREAQPYFQAHRGSTFVLVLSAQIVDSPYLPSILEVA
ncbi:hypothetical protein ACH5RR_011551 [Cinchona calisaya]|uniref:Uncharacterized protein n=1 Tax=Cinchona calisaya TaxID=153742 RepID=A0ABD3A572_9GENT